MNAKIYKTMTLSSKSSPSQLKDATLSCFIGYSVDTQTISSIPKRTLSVRAKEIVKKSLEQSLKANAEVWAELSKH